MKKSQVKKKNFSLEKQIFSFLCGVPIPKRNIGPVDDPVLSLLALAFAFAGKRKLLIVSGMLSLAERINTEIELWSETVGCHFRTGVLPEGTAIGQVLTEADSPRARVLYQVIQNPPEILCTSLSALFAPAPKPERMANSEITLKPGMELPLQNLAKQLVEMEYDDENEVSVPGEFARRGGILDLYSPASEYPARIEYFGDTIESIRAFRPETQKSFQILEEYRVILRSGSQNSPSPEKIGTFLDYYETYHPLVVLAYPEDCRRHLERFGADGDLQKWDEFLKKLPADGLICCLDAPEAAMASEVMRSPCFPSAAHILKSIPEEAEDSFSELARQISENLVRQWLEEGKDVVLAGKNEPDLHYIRQWQEEAGIPDQEKLHLLKSPIPSGVFLPGVNLAVLTEQELFSTPQRLKSPRLIKKDVLESTENNVDFSSMADLEEGDYAVHINFGICIYRGLRQLETSAGREEVLALEFADDTVVNIPVWQAHYLSRYIGAKKTGIPLSRIAGSKWSKIKEHAVSSIQNLAFDLLKTQALRSSVTGEPFPLDDLNQRLFEQSFPFQETPDQIRAAEEIKQDMESPKPMDRLLCGDVGYGKTEMAMRAAFKSVMAGRQVAILVPTTILAQQHYLSFLERFAETPVVIETLSRFKTKTEQAKIIQRLKDGSVDIVIGTHRLVQGDIEFKNLGLIIIDEEQRFGVAHKERLKHLRATVDILTMTATPIPRTLYLSMAGMRDLSTLMTAPVQRLPVQTLVAQEEEAVIRHAVMRELQRGGQVYYVHNRVATIDDQAIALKRMFPDARIGVGHGQMGEDQLENTMNSFIGGNLDILVCTTIIESGLDIPNANTIIIDRADRFGLAELYQLRGRVGRWTRQAYAVFLLPKSGLITGDARKRIAAIRRFTHLGSGFRLAMRDLEIRGSGNILGAEQSGQMNAVGFHLYCQLLRACINQLNGKPEESRIETSLSFDFLNFALEPARGKIAAGFPDSYINSPRLRLDAYRRLASINSMDEMQTFENEIADRFGKIPKIAENLFLTARIRLAASLAKVHSIVCREGKVFIEKGTALLKPENGMIPRLKEKTPEKQLREVDSLIRKLFPGSFTRVRA